MHRVLHLVILVALVGVSLQAAPAPSKDRPFPTISKSQLRQPVARTNDPGDGTGPGVPIYVDPPEDGGGGYTGACVEKRKCNFSLKSCEIGTTGCANTYNSCKSCTWF